MAEQANYQGEHLGLSLNRDAVFALNDALEQLRFTVRDHGSAAVPLRLPDGRTLQLRLSLTDAGVIRDEHGEYLDDDGIAHGDVTGDLAAHAEARQVLDTVERPYLWPRLSDKQLDGTEQVDVDQLAVGQVDGAIDSLPWRYGRTDAWVEQLRARATDRAREVLPAALAETREVHRLALADRAHSDNTHQPDPARSDGDPDAGPAAERPGRSEAAPGVNGDAMPAMKPPSRLKNFYDDIRRGSSASVRNSTEQAAAAVDRGDHTAAAEWDDWADNQRRHTERARSRAVELDGEEVAADPDGYAQRLAEARTVDAGEYAAVLAELRDDAYLDRDIAAVPQRADTGVASRDAADGRRSVAEARTVDASEYAAVLAELRDDAYLDRDIAAVPQRADTGVASRDAADGRRSVEVAGVEPAALQPPARPRNRFDDDRRAETDQARERRGWAAQAAADGRDSHASYWTAQADRFDEYAGQSRRAAITEAGHGQVAEPAGHALPSATAHASDISRTAGSDGRSGGAGMAM